MLIQLENDRALDIRPGEKDFQVSDEFTLPVDVDVLGVYPHAQYLGTDLRAWATVPGGERREMIWIRRWDQNWQAVYRYAKPLYLPKGSIISMRYSYDNSAENPFNPSRPPRRVVAGNLATDEMSHLWVQVLPRDESDDSARLALQEALARAKLRKDPTDFSANYNLGAVLNLQERYAEAVPALRRALATAPDDATVYNTLGAALRGSGNTDGAIEQFDEALRLRPGYADARFNLADALLAADRTGEAIAQLRALLAANSNDSAARSKLAGVFQEQGKALAQANRMKDALAAFEEARTLTPDDPDLLTNLGVVLARMGSYPQAAAAFERALQLAPGHPVAQRNLRLVRQALAKQVP
jgi:tetratricopeptide (TPR) repeat protein